MAETDNTKTEEQSKDNVTLFGRKWRILIYKDTEVAIDASELRCEFQVQQNFFGQPFVCYLTIYNLNAATESAIIKEGYAVVIEAGFEGQYGKIFDGDIVQVIRNREGGVDYRLEILALDGSAFLDLNFIRSSLAANSKPREIIQQIAKESKKPIEIEKVSEYLTPTNLPRGKILFGPPNKYLSDICEKENAALFVDKRKLNVIKVSDPIPEDKVIYLTPATGLVDTPQYTDDGIIIKMLLNASVVPLTMIKLDNEIIRRQLVQVPTSGQGTNQVPQQTVFDEDGEYQAFLVTHRGDTYGNEWITEVTACGRNGRTGLLLMVNNSGQTPTGA